jgi:hypothetical protein
VTYLKIVEAGDGGRHEHFLKEGEVQNIHNVLFSVNKFTDGAIKINTTGTLTPFKRHLKETLCEWLINYKEM